MNKLFVVLSLLLVNSSFSVRAQSIINQKQWTPRPPEYNKSVSYQRQGTPSAVDSKSFSAIEREAQRWYDSMAADPVEKGIKEKTYLFEKQSYSISGFFQKGELANGKFVAIYDITNTPEVILEGKVSYLAGRLVVTGKKYCLDQPNVETYGAFYVSNTPDGLMTYKTNKAGDLTIEDKDIFFHYGVYQGSPCIIDVKNGRFALNGKIGGRSYDELNFQIPKQSIDSIGYSDIVSLMLCAKDDVVFKEQDGSSFSGTVKPTLLDDGRVSFTYLNGQRSHLPSDFGEYEIRVSLYGEGLMHYKSDPNPQSRLKSTTIYTNRNRNDINNWWDVSEYIANPDKVIWEYRNGDIYEGEASFKIREDGALITTLGKGTMSYLNGDAFEGNLSGKAFYGIPIEGKTKFRDNTTAEGNWLEVYRLTPSQYSSLASLHFPTAIRDSALAFRDDNQFQLYVKAAEEAERDGDLDAAVTLLNKAQEFKTDDTISKRASDLEHRIALQEWKKKLVSKYGEKYGNMVFNQEIALGMTKEMVQDVLSSDDIVANSYNKSLHTSSLGEIETWEYSYNKARAYMNSQTGDAAEANAIILLSEAYGFNVRAEIEKKVQYKYIQFTNGKVTALREGDDWPF